MFILFGMFLMGVGLMMPNDYAAILLGAAGGAMIGLGAYDIWYGDDN